MTTVLTTTSPAAEPERPPRGRLKRLVLGRPSDPRWARPALWAVLVLAAVLYSWDLSRNGNANAFYAAAVLSGTESWKAFFYGSLDSASFITVDKPPFAFWVMGISARIFGYNSWSLLLPQAAEGVAAVAILYAAVRRSVASLTRERGAYVAALIAALALTLTPMVVAINRDDNPDTMLTLLLVIGTWGLLESLRAGRTDPDGQAGLDGQARLDGRTRKGHPLLWLMVSAVAFGLAFDTKMLEGFIALPILPIVYLIASKARPRTRIVRLSAAGGVLAVIALSWMTKVDLIPKTSRPYVGSSSNDTVWNLAVGYNGFGRITGSRGGFGGAGGAGFTGPTRSAAGTGAGTGTGTGAGGFGAAGSGGTGTAGGTGGAGNFAEFAHRAAGGGAGGFGGQAGIGRMFASTLGGQISWLIPFAAIALIAAIVLIGRRPRTDLARAGVLVFGGWLLLEFIVLSFQQGTQHPYYTSAMAPPIAALTGIGVVALYQAYRRSNWWSLVLPTAIAITGIWAFVLLRRTPGWNPWLAWTVAGATAVAVLALAFGWLRSASAAGNLGRPGSRDGNQPAWQPARPDGEQTGWQPARQDKRQTAWEPASTSAEYASQQADARGAEQADPQADARGAEQADLQADGRRVEQAARGRGRLLALAGVAGLIAVLAGPAAYAMTPLSQTISGNNPVAGPAAGGGLGGFGGFAGFTGRTGAGTFGTGTGRTGTGTFGTGGTGTGRAGTGGTGTGTLGAGAGRGVGGAGGAASTALIAYLKAHRDRATWLVAVQGSSAAAAIILETGGLPVMAMGGFTGSDPAPTAAQLEQDVKQGKLHYVLTGGGGGFGGRAGGTTSVTSWVEQNCTAVPASAYSSTSATSSATATAETLYHCG